MILIAAGLAAAGYLAYAGAIFFARKQFEREVKNRADTLRQHLANLLGRTVAGRPPDPKKPRDPYSLDWWRKEVAALFKELKELVGGKISEIRKVLADRGWTQEEIEDFFKALHEAGLL